MTDSESPTGRFVIGISAWEARMSLWIETPTLSERLTGKQLLAFKDPNWSLDSADWLNDSTVVLKLRKYPGNHVPTGLIATVDCLAGTAVIGETRVDSLECLEDRLDKALTWRNDYAPPAKKGRRGLREFFQDILGGSRNHD